MMEVLEGPAVETILDWRVIAVVIAVFVIRLYFKGKRFNEKVSAKKLVAVITGANRGIGKQIARELNIRGATVYLLCRDEERALCGKTELVKLGCSPDRLIVKIVDLTKFATIRAAAKDIERSETKIDILINNAGVMYYPKFKLTDDGHELVWQTNYLGHFFLTELLLPLLRNSPASRIINVSGHSGVISEMIDLATIDRREGWDTRQSYVKSKLATLMHAEELTKRLRIEEASHVTINACHPGFCYTRIFRYTPLVKTPLKQILSPFCWFFLKTSNDGAQTPLFIALSEKVAGHSGSYYRECALQEFLKPDDWDERCKELYDYSLTACNLGDS